jgi:predicted nucleotidyltransferase
MESVISKESVINNIEIRDLCKVLNVETLYLFGSILTQNFTKESDIDFLVTFKKSLSVEEYTNNFFELYNSLENILNCKIDLLTENMLSNPYFIEEINKNKQLVYES